MAKRKAKKNNLVGLIATAVCLAMGVAAICFLFAPGVTLKAGNEAKNISCFQVMFGWTEKTSELGSFGGSILSWILGSDKIQITNFNFVPFLGFLFVIAGAVLSLFPSKNIVLKLLPALCFVLAGVLFFVTLAAFPVGLTTDGKKVYDALKDSFSLGWGAIVAGVCALLGAGVSACKSFLLK